MEHSIFTANGNTEEYDYLLSECPSPNLTDPLSRLFIFYDIIIAGSTNSREYNTNSCFEHQFLKEWSQQCSVSDGRQLEISNANSEVRGQVHPREIFNRAIREATYRMLLHNSLLFQGRLHISNSQENNISPSSPKFANGKVEENILSEENLSHKSIPPLSLKMEKYHRRESLETHVKELRLSYFQRRLCDAGGNDSDDQRISPSICLWSSNNDDLLSIINIHSIAEDSRLPLTPNKRGKISQCAEELVGNIREVRGQIIDSASAEKSTVGNKRDRCLVGGVGDEWVDGGQTETFDRVFLESYDDVIHPFLKRTFRRIFFSSTMDMSRESSDDKINYKTNAVGASISDSFISRALENTLTLDVLCEIMSVYEAIHKHSLGEEDNRNGTSHLSSTFSLPTQLLIDGVDHFLTSFLSLQTLKQLAMRCGLTDAMIQDAEKIKKEQCNKKVPSSITSSSPVTHTIRSLLVDFIMELIFPAAGSVSGDWLSMVYNRAVPEELKSSSDEDLKESIIPVPPLQIDTTNTSDDDDIILSEDSLPVILLTRPSIVPKDILLARRKNLWAFCVSGSNNSHGATYDSCDKGSRENTSSSSLFLRESITKMTYSKYTHVKKEERNNIRASSAGDCDNTHGGFNVPAHASSRSDENTNANPYPIIPIISELHPFCSITGFELQHHFSRKELISFAVDVLWPALFHSSSSDGMNATHVNEDSSMSPPDSNYIKDTIASSKNNIISTSNNNIKTAVSKKHFSFAVFKKDCHNTKTKLELTNLLLSLRDEVIQRV